MEIFREGKLVNSELGTGNILSVQIGKSAAKALVDDRYTMKRFSQFRHQGLGWDFMDKAHIYLRHPNEQSRDQGEGDEDDRLLRLNLDNGGDLYFTIRETEDLQSASHCEVFPRDEVLDSDPGQKLDRLGIVVVRFYGLHILARELYEPQFFVRDRLGVEIET